MTACLTKTIVAIREYSLKFILCAKRDSPVRVYIKAANKDIINNVRKMRSSNLSSIDIFLNFNTVIKAMRIKIEVRISTET